MIELYTWSTPNGRKISIMLEECGLAYNVHRINIGAGDQFAPDYVAINANAKIPLDRRPRRSRQEADRDDGVGSDPDLPVGEDRQVPAE